MITGYFDPVHVEHARRLKEFHDGSCNVIVLADPPQPISPQRVRAEVLAGLASVDYVVLTDGGSAEDVLRSFPNAICVREEDADTERTRRLIEHVHARQTAK